MKKLLLGLMLITSVTAQAILIKGEDTPGKYIRIIPHNDIFLISECQLAMNTLNCEDLFGKNSYLNMIDINETSHTNSKNKLYSTIGIPLTVAATYVAGIYGGFAVATYVGASKAASLVIGSVTIYGGAPVAASVPLFINELDPFMHRDLELAFKASINLATEDDLDDIEAQYINDELAVVIESVDFEFLKEKMISQLQGKIKSPNNFMPEEDQNDNLSPAERILQKRMIGL